MSQKHPQKPPPDFKPLPPEIEAKLLERARWLTFSPFALLTLFAWWHEAATMDWLADHRLLEIALPVISLGWTGALLWLMSYGQWWVLMWLSSRWKKRHRW